MNDGEIQDWMATGASRERDGTQGSGGRRESRQKEAGDGDGEGEYGTGGSESIVNGASCRG